MRDVVMAVLCVLVSTAPAFAASTIRIMPPDGGVLAAGQLVDIDTATDVPLSATGPGAWQFTGVFENTDVLLKMLRAATGTYGRALR